MRDITCPKSRTANTNCANGFAAKCNWLVRSDQGRTDDEKVFTFRETASSPSISPKVTTPAVISYAPSSTCGFRSRFIHGLIADVAAENDW